MLFFPWSSSFLWKRLYKLIEGPTRLGCHPGWLLLQLKAAFGSSCYGVTTESRATFDRYQCSVPETFKLVVLLFRASRNMMLLLAKKVKPQAQPHKSFLDKTYNKLSKTPEHLGKAWETLHWINTLHLFPLNAHLDPPHRPAGKSLTGGFAPAETLGEGVLQTC